MMYNDDRKGLAKLIRGSIAERVWVDNEPILERWSFSVTRAEGKRLGRPPGSKDNKKGSRRGYLIRWSE